MGDAEEPRPERQVLIGGAESRVGPDEYVLEGVLGVLATGQHLPGVGEETLVVAIVDRPEGFVVAGPEQRDELFVGTEAK
jgi:hypothetical protein